MEKKPIMFSIKHTERTWGNLMRKIALESGIPGSYQPVIMFLSRHGEASQKQLSEFSHTTYAAMSRTIREMLEDGYITKSTDGEDRRYAKIALTEKGIECDNNIRGKIRAAENAISKAIGKDKQRELEETLSIITDLINEKL